MGMKLEILIHCDRVGDYAEQGEISFTLPLYLLKFN
jgi:hypothetical protein